MTITDGSDLVSPASYALHGAPHQTWTRLRRESPIHHCDPSGFQPFWAITKHADICNISKQPGKFLNAPGIVAHESALKGGELLDVPDFDPR